MEKRVGILGGTFDPVHCGHVTIARSFLRSGLIDELLVLLSPYPPHKREKEQADFSHRFQMLQIAFEDMENVTASNLEKELPEPSYTIQTIKKLQKAHPETLFYLCLGEDSLRDFHTWHRFEDILKRVDLLVVDRPGFDHSQVRPDILEHVIFVDHEPYSVSSTEIRQSGAVRKKDLPDDVATYITKNNLYGNSPKSASSE